MFKCEVCGSNESQEGVVNEIFQIDSRPVLVENIPTTICLRCGDKTFSRETTERIRRMVHGESKPTNSLKMDVYAY